MKIIDSAFSILYIQENALDMIEQSARICYASDIGKNQEGFLKNLIKRGHMTPFEQASATIKIVCDRGVMAELTRHRLASFNVQSTRYCNFSKGKFSNEITVVRPSFWNERSGAYGDWKKHMQTCEDTYMWLIETGNTPQEARSVLPNSLATEIIMTVNFRELMHIFKLRCSDASHPDMHHLMRPMLAEFKFQFPVIFGDIKGD